ncbi:MAG: hypothetical protein QOE36_1477 [Gaiellaceae bacterium]|nr:hypothetical protein [Gaiellaceae bacterium]
MTKTRIAPAAVFATVALVCAASASAEPQGGSGKWSVEVVLTQTTKWNYTWDGTGLDGCTQSEHGSGSETIVLRTGRVARQRLGLDGSGHLRVGATVLGLARGTRVRRGTFVTVTESGLTDSCEASTVRRPTGGCGSRAYRPGFALAADGGLGGFRLVTRGGAGTAGACPAPPSFSSERVAFGSARVLHGSIPLSSLRNPRIASVTVSVAYSGEAPYAGTNIDRPEQDGRVATQVRATILLRRL